ncbi:hypothetical protein [Criblamydia sequanensis]|uniref:Uncharacterized protein n=1 Tax=Candidatus Criblamydia sequanensis CRIB-18 TaxID=1437425 RepID=A0A090D0Y9_9BACT|nr:hypothetical protein [Criblamydia sequanensis]CDR35031.1 hypothetical protein CSEC_2225 [Criblamydia sequanensis CRIB-18]
MEISRSFVIGNANSSNQTELRKEVEATLDVIQNLAKDSLAGLSKQDEAELHKLESKLKKALSGDLSQKGIQKIQALITNSAVFIKEVINENPSLSIEGLEKWKALSKELQKAAIKEEPSLSELCKGENVVDGLNQVAVLNQYEDTTESGFENCGFHSLKNALIVQAKGELGDEIQQMLEDPKVFMAFYDSYCAPLLENLPKGKKDATLPLLRDAIKLAVQDKNPPFSLKTLIEALKSQDPPALLLISTSNGEETGDPLFLPIDVNDTAEYQKLIDFASKEGPSHLSCVLGNQQLGHWYVLHFEKDKEGNVKSFGLDSMTNDHDILGEFSSLAKMNSLLLKAFQNPDILQKAAYQPIDDLLSTRGSWVDSNGRVDSQESFKSLLDETPNPHFASENTPTGSNLERILATCHRAIQFLQANQLLDNDDYELQSKIADIDRLLTFYGQNLGSDPKYSLLNTDKATLDAHNKREALVDHIFDEAITFIEGKKHELNSYEYEQNLTLFTEMRNIYHKRKGLSSISREEDRLKELNQESKAKGIEDGFINGTTPSQIEGSVIARVSTLLSTYQQAKKTNSMNRFFKVVSQGDGCLTGRMGRVAAYKAELSGFGEVKEAIEREKVAQPPVYALQQFFEQRTDTDNDDAEPIADQINSFKIEDLNDETTLEEMASQFQIYCKGELSKSFRLFLVEQNIIKEDDPQKIDWAAALQKMIDLKEFRVWVESAKKQAIKSLLELQEMDLPRQ